MASAARGVPSSDAVNTSDSSADQSKRYRLFKQFHKRVGLKPFAPEFADSLVHTMRTPGISLTEQVWAWVRWRAWLNSSESPVSDWNPESAYLLDQKDCALDLWWFRQGKSVEWVEGAPREHREHERNRPEVVKLKTSVNDAFLQVKARGHIDIEGHRIYALVSPQVIGSPSKIPGTRDFSPKDKAFMEWWKSLEPGIFQEFEDSWNQYMKARKIARTRYKQYLGSRNSGQGILITVITSNELGNTDTGEGVSTRHSSSPEPDPEPTPPPPPPTKHEPLRMPEPLPPLPGPTEPEPETALALVSENTKRELAWESLRATFDGCGKPISVKRAKECREEFFKYSLEGQLFIAQDATIRAHELWNEPRWTPDPLDYLKSRIWDEKPVKRRSFPAPIKKSKGQEAMDRVMADAIARTEKAARNGSS